ncbi:MAG: hypothetical protein H7Y59_06520 [Anaerolineales bacterium]|nr:hypothetical protein [Anaerolineales bacterium]
MKAETRVSTSMIAVMILTTITALIHFERAIQDPDIRILFILNGMGFFALLAAFYMPMFQKHHKLVRWTYIGYTAVTILLYFVWVAMSGEWTIPLGPIAKLVEAALIVLIYREP